MNHVGSFLAGIIAMLVLLSPAATSSAQSPTSGEDLTKHFGGDSPWAVSADQTRTEDLIPLRVLQMHKMQTVDLRCRIGAAGLLVGCQVDAESTPNLGLCQGALAAAARARLKDHFPNGDILEGLYAVVVMVFDAGGDPPHRIYPRLAMLARGPLEPARHPLAPGAESPPSDCAKLIASPV